MIFLIPEEICKISTTKVSADSKKVEVIEKCFPCFFKTFCDPIILGRVGYLGLA